MTPYPCDTRSVCTGPAPFDANVAPCCDEHEEEWTRERVRKHCKFAPSPIVGTTYGTVVFAFGFCWDGSAAHHIANHVGVHPIDMARFLGGEASLTAPARLKIRGVLA